MKIKADAEAYYNRTIAASLTQYVVMEDWIEKWNGQLPTVQGGQGMMFDMSKFVKYRKPIEEIENGYIRTCIYEAYRTCGNAYTSDSLMSNRAKFEADVRARLEKSLAAEGFIVDEFTSAITPPQSLTEMIDAKNRAKMYGTFA